MRGEHPAARAHPEREVLGAQANKNFRQLTSRVVVLVELLSSVPAFRVW